MGAAHRRAVDRAVIDRLRPVGAASAVDSKGVVSIIFNCDGTVLFGADTKSGLFAVIGLAASHHIGPAIVVHPVHNVGGGDGDDTVLACHRLLSGGSAVVNGQGGVLHHAPDKAGFGNGIRAGVGQLRRQAEAVGSPLLNGLWFCDGEGKGLYRDGAGCLCDVAHLVGHGDLHRLFSPGIAEIIRQSEGGFPRKAAFPVGGGNPGPDGGGQLVVIRFLHDGDGSAEKHRRGLIDIFHLHRVDIALLLPIGGFIAVVKSIFPVLGNGFCWFADPDILIALVVFNLNGDLHILLGPGIGGEGMAQAGLEHGAPILQVKEGLVGGQDIVVSRPSQKAGNGVDAVRLPLGHGDDELLRPRPLLSYAMVGSQDEPIGVGNGIFGLTRQLPRQCDDRLGGDLDVVPGDPHIGDGEGVLLYALPGAAVADQLHPVDGNSPVRPILEI